MRTVRAKGHSRQIEGSSIGEHATIFPERCPASHIQCDRMTVTPKFIVQADIRNANSVKRNSPTCVIRSLSQGRIAAESQDQHHNEKKNHSPICRIDVSNGSGLSISGKMVGTHFVVATVVESRKGVPVDSVAEPRL